MFFVHPSEIESIVGGFHGDPFRVLGPHAIDTGDDQEEVWEVRAFLPQAQEVWLMLGAARAPMMKKHPQGFWTARLAYRPDSYRLQLKLWHGDAVTIEDPYRFAPILTDFDLHLHAEGSLFESYKTMGAHLVASEGVAGVRFAVWAPNAEVVAVVGDFNEWDTRRHPMRRRNSGVWEIFIPGIGEGVAYKYNVRSRVHGFQQMKADPYAFRSEVPPKSASVVARIEGYEWGDAEWMEARGKKNWLKEPVSIYEVHLESWLRGPQGRALTYRELAETLVPYVQRMGYTHMEMLPVMEHPFSGSWGYQVVGYYSPTARFGSPDDLRYLIDRCHQAGIGVIVDWVPGHFPKDAHGLAYFDGTALYEHQDPRLGEHREWGTLIFNYGRNEVRTFLISNGLFWLKEYHVDGLRVDAVASMLYLDYSRQPGEWLPNRYGGRENLEAIEFLRQFNIEAHKIPGALTMAEESTSFPGVSRPVYLNGLGFTMKWNMGWMHDMLHYFSVDPVYRPFHHNDITFSLMYAFSENFVLPISHDEVVHGKSSFLNKMPGDEWRQFANARAFLAYMWGHPGKKLLFMGSEIGQREEWNHHASVRWELLEFAPHRGLQDMMRDLNRLYREHPAMHQVDDHWSGFEWVDFHDVAQSIISFLRNSDDRKETLLFCCNFTPVPRHKYRIGVPSGGTWKEIFNTDAGKYFGANAGNGGRSEAEAVEAHGRPFSLSLTLPALAVVVFQKPPDPVAIRPKMEPAE